MPIKDIESNEYLIEEHKVFYQYKDIDIPTSPYLKPINVISIVLLIYSFISIIIMFLIILEFELNYNIFSSMGFIEHYLFMYQIEFLAVSFLTAIAEIVFAIYNLVNSDKLSNSDKTLFINILSNIIIIIWMLISKHHIIEKVFIILCFILSSIFAFKNYKLFLFRKDQAERNRSVAIKNLEQRNKIRRF